MNTVTIYGASDDLIEVESGNPSLCEEFGNEKGFLFFDDGTIVKVEYDEKGVWKVAKVSGPAEVVSHTYAHESSDEDEYSDKMTIQGEFKRVECFKHNPPTLEDYRDLMEDFDCRGYSLDQLKRIYAITKESR